MRPPTPIPPRSSTNGMAQGCAVGVFLLVGLIAVTPLIWLARVTLAWALGL